MLVTYKLVKTVPYPPARRRAIEIVCVDGKRGEGVGLWGERCGHARAGASILPENENYLLMQEGK